MKKEERKHPVFETSHILGSLLASSPLLSDAWSHCCLASSSSARAPFVVTHARDATYVAFSGVQGACGGGGGGGGGVFGEVPIDAAGDGIFSSLVDRSGGGSETVLVHGEFLGMFMALYGTTEFQMLLTKDITTTTPLILTGHSIGGAIASLAALSLLASPSRSPRAKRVSPPSLLCITFGAPLLGNKPLSDAILRARWHGKFCHVVSNSDIVPRLLFAQIAPIAHQVKHLFDFYHSHMIGGGPVHGFPDDKKAGLYRYVAMQASAATENEHESDHVDAFAMRRRSSPYSPFGSYLFCTREGGATCVDSPSMIAHLLWSTFVMGAVEREEHLMYGDLVVGVFQRSMTRSDAVGLNEGSCYDAGISLALEGCGCAVGRGAIMESRELFKMARENGVGPNLEAARLSIELSKKTPHRLQIECYYDAFNRRSSKRDNRANMHRIKLASFWEEVVSMVEMNQLPHDFGRLRKWVYASHSYKLLVEPLDVAEYYRKWKSGEPHYLGQGRPRRYRVFDKWWEEAFGGTKEGRVRRRYAGLTQDSCFWGRVEEAKEWLKRVERGGGGEGEEEGVMVLLERLRGFEEYARGLVGRREVSEDVVVERSSYWVWMERWAVKKMELGL
ncbi:hypothetical protein QJS04_geneDACA016552 [Acorus gramineus]|uniref:Lipase-like PAD4 n=1 Tax=Acorus gramineus TaxID=55184 RepID=A0AAV9BN53_ACOGR|nr:hypothetical protein QJS04_geneDACA016552 [Acorus gramineus]